jgi:hypothetical protein
MASLSNVNTSATSAVDIPEVWASRYADLLKSNLAAAKCFADFSEEISGYGDKIHIPNNTTEQTAVDYTEGQRLTDLLQADTEGETTIDITSYKVNPFVISDRLKVQSYYREKDMKYSKAAYAVAKAIDTQILAHSSSFSNTVNSGGGAVTNIDLTEAQRLLDAADVPEDDRWWIFHPNLLKDLKDLTGNYFTSLDFTETKSLVKGQIHQLLLGSPVIKSTNVPTGTFGSPAASGTYGIYAHRDAIAFAMQFRPEVQETKAGDGVEIDIQGKLCNVRGLYGTSLWRANHGVRIGESA